jgi:hypothetical protein
VYKQYVPISFAGIISINHIEGVKRLIRSGQIGIIFLELNWGKTARATCPATESIRLLERAGYPFSRAGKCLNWKRRMTGCNL